MHIKLASQYLNTNRIVVGGHLCEHLNKRKPMRSARSGYVSAGATNILLLLAASAILYIGMKISDIFGSVDDFEDKYLHPRK